MDFVLCLISSSIFGCTTETARRKFIQCVRLCKIMRFYSTAHKSVAFAGICGGALSVEWGASGYANAPVPTTKQSGVVVRPVRPVRQKHQPKLPPAGRAFSPTVRRNSSQRTIQAADGSCGKVGGKLRQRRGRGLMSSTEAVSDDLPPRLPTSARRPHYFSENFIFPFDIISSLC